MIEKILLHGNKRMDRTGTGTLSCFGGRCDTVCEMAHSRSDDKARILEFAEELLWFVSGNTNAKDLQDKNIHIWDGNGSREYLDSIGLTKEEMDHGLSTASGGTLAQSTRTCTQTMLVKAWTKSRVSFLFMVEPIVTLPPAGTNTHASQRSSKRSRRTQQIGA